MENILTAEGINKSFQTGKGEERHILKGIDIEVRSGEFVSIMGPSGSGKSTLLYILSGIDIDYSGSVEINGKNITKLKEEERSQMRREHFGFVFQNPTMLKNLNLIDNIMLPALKEKSPNLKNKARKLMEDMKISGLSDRETSKVSGGELQRAGICRALMNDPKVLFADEPTGALNSKTSAEIIDIFKALNQEKTTVVMVTHDPKVAERSDRILFMKDGEIVKDLDLTNTPKELKTEVVRENLVQLDI